MKKVRPQKKTFRASTCAVIARYTLFARSSYPEKITDRTKNTQKNSCTLAVLCVRIQTKSRCLVIGDETISSQSGFCRYKTNTKTVRLYAFFRVNPTTRDRLIETRPAKSHYPAMQNKFELFFCILRSQPDSRICFISSYSVGQCFG